PTCAAARARPRVAIESVRAFGTRLVRRSKAALTAALPATATSTASEVVGNGNPQDHVDDGTDLADRGHRHERDQHDEHSVFDQPLSVVSICELFEGAQDFGGHASLSPSAAPLAPPC